MAAGADHPTRDSSALPGADSSARGCFATPVTTYKMLSASGRSDVPFHGIAAVLALVIVVVTLNWGSTAVGGADEYSYVSAAGLLRQGRLVVYQDVVRESPWPGALGTWTPIGYTEVLQDRHAITPVVPPGLPLLMAGLQGLFGFCAAFWVVPICAGATVWLTYMLGRRVFDRPSVALGAAFLVAASPTFLNQAMGPLSDVPATAWWMLALVLLLAEQPVAAGFAAAGAIAIRPNLAPLSLALLTWTVLRDRQDPASGRRGARTLRVGLAIVVALIAFGGLNVYLYGSPLRSGYGELNDLYSWRYLWTNVRQFSIWASETDTPIVALAATFFLAPRFLAAPRVAFPRVLFGAFAAIVLLSYVFYLPFDAWWFLRFLLPMWPVVMLLTMAALDAIACRWLGPAARRGALIAIVVLLAWHGVAVTINRGCFTRWRVETRYVDVARFIDASTDPSAVLIGGQHTGSIRFYADRLTLNFAALDRRWLDRAVARLRATGHRPYFVLDASEIDKFRQRFSAENRLGALDWSPVAVYEDSYVAIYDPETQRVGVAPRVIASSVERSGHVCRRPQPWPPRLRFE